MPDRPEFRWQLIECGFCRHPEFSVRRDGRWKVCEFPALVALLTHPTRGHLLFDTGYSQHFFSATDPFPERLYRCVTPVQLGNDQNLRQQLERRGIAARDVGHVFISHFHGDHVGGLPDFPDSRVFCAEEAWTDLHGRSRVSRVRVGLLDALAPKAMSSRLSFLEHLPEVSLPPEFAPFNSARDLFGDGSALAVNLPGHAAGHWGLAFRSEGRWIFLLGDAAWSSDALRAGSPPPRLTTAWLGDTRQYRETFQALHQLAVRDSGILLVPAHCAEFRP
jgi:glyoxylase-like metal-dependent hydrolase (beta-lactamase superfamily II)